MHFHILVSFFLINELSMTELLDNTRANLPHELTTANELLAYHIYALLKRQKAYAGIHFENVDEDDGEGGEDEVNFSEVSTTRPSNPISYWGNSKLAGTQTEK